MRGVLDAEGYMSEDDEACVLEDNMMIGVPTDNEEDLSDVENITADSSDEICTATCTVDTDGNKTCTFSTVIHIMAGELGYIGYKECGDIPNPTIGMEIGATYYFDQSDVSNHMHPLGFAYYPDGAHDDQPELEPGIKPENSASACEDSMSCPAPMYMLGDEYLGAYSNNDMIVPMTMGEDDFGLDVYEPLFFYPLLDWKDKGEWKVALKLDVEDDPQDMFYFCHIHQFMSGRIKVINSDGSLKQEENIPELGYEYDQPSAFDSECGTFNTGQYQLPQSMCPEKFVCDVPDENVDLMGFSQCIEAMDCAMVVGMTNTVKSNSEVALFIHQMIPHHQNAVNMAKALLKSGKLDCEDISDDENADCVMEEITRSIINYQNHQIQSMRGVLDAEGYMSEDDEACLALDEPTEEPVEPVSEVTTQPVAAPINPPTAAPINPPTAAPTSPLRSPTMAPVGSSSSTMAPVDSTDDSSAIRRSSLNGFLILGLLVVAL